MQPNEFRIDTSNTLTVRECVFDVMRSFGADTIFGNPGSTELNMFRDFPEDFRYVLGLQEAVVVGIADGYAQAGDRIAFVNLHSAAGVGNAMGNIHTAYKNRTPLVIIAGQQSRPILPYDPYLASDDAAQLPKPYIKWSVEPARAEDVPQAIATACQRALQAPCGPVLVSVPSDDWDQLSAPVASRKVSHQSRPDPSMVAELASALARSARPALVSGAEVDRDGAWDEIVQLAEQHHAAVYGAPKSPRGAFPEDHPLFMGTLGASRERIVEQLTGHDLILVIGAPVFTYHVDGKGPHAPPGAQVWQITEDPLSAARSPIGNALVSTVTLALRDLLIAGVTSKRARPPARPPTARVAPGDPLQTAYVLQTLNGMRSPEDIIVEEAPSSRRLVNAHLPVLRQGTFFTMASGGLGYGMPAAVGVAMAHPEKRVIGVIGDGSSMYSIQALWNAAQLGLNVVYLVLNNQRYAALQQFTAAQGLAPQKHLPGTQLPGLDFVQLAQGQGVRAQRVTDTATLHTALQECFASRGPSLLDIRVV